MGFIWFWIVAVMLAAYVVLDGFDLGVGILHPLLARSEHERQIDAPHHRPGMGRQRSLAARRRRHSLLRLPAALRLRVQRILSGADDCAVAAHPARRQHRTCARIMHIGVWRSFFDGLFFVSSALLAIFFGAALANVIRGVPLGADGYFFLPLWTNWRPGVIPASGLVHGPRWDVGLSRWPSTARFTSQ